VRFQQAPVVWVRIQRVSQFDCKPAARAKKRNFPKVIYILGVRVKNDLK